VATLRKNMEAEGNRRLLNGTLIKRLLAIGGGIIAVADALETLSDLPATIAKYKTFFSILYHLLSDAGIIFAFLVFKYVLPFGILVIALQFIYIIIKGTFFLATSGRRNRLWLFRAEKWVISVIFCAIGGGIVYLAVISDGHPFEEAQDRLIDWDRDRRLNEMERERHQRINDCIKTSKTDKDKYDCLFTD
jgi:hypothetical protein